MTQTGVHHQWYEVFQKQRQSLFNLLKQQIEVLRSLDMKVEEETLQQLQTRVQQDNFKVLILGRFKAGKSTFINALLGQEILPAYSIPTTAIINEVKWGKTKRALLHFADDGNGSKPAKEVPVEDLEEYVVIRDGAGTQEQRNPYQKVELFWPLKLCENGVEIVDSPGLDEHEVREKVTTDYVPIVDAVLFILSCEALAGKAEVEFIENNLLSIGHEELFFICNRINQVSKKERERLKEYGYAKLSPLTELGKDGIFYINALGALEGRTENNEDEVNQSGVPELETELAQFLTSRKGRIKILQPAKKIKNTIYKARRTIPEREKLLKTDFQTIEQRYETAKEPLQLLEAERQQIVLRISNFVEDTRQQTKDKASLFYQELADKIGDLLKDYELQNQIKFVSREGLKFHVERAVNEITEYLSSQVEGELGEWQKIQLQPFVESGIETLGRDLDERAQNFVNKVDELRFQLSGVSALDVQQEDIGPKKVSALERILSAAGGLFIGGVGMAGIGAVFGYQEMLKSLLPQIAIAAATVVLVGWNPLVLIPAMAAGGFIQGLITSKAANKKIKEEVGKRFANEIRSSKYQRADEIADAVAKKLGEIKAAVDEGLAKEIQSIRDQVESILAEKRKGQTNVEQKLKELESIRNQMNEIDSKLDDLIAEVAVQ
jgi:GTPase SAR1 family protein/flagellar capping protein FliD